MKILVLVLAVTFVVYLAYAGIRFYKSVQISKQLIHAAVPYAVQGENGTYSVLVLGDSTAVGVGADSPETSLAGRVASYTGATSVENYSKSGAVTTDLPGQMARAKSESYNLILVQVGGNDIIRFRSAEEAAEQLDAALSRLPASERVVVISAGNVGGAPLFPFFLRPFYTSLNMQYHEAFDRVVSAKGYTYVNLYTSPGGKIIEEQPEIYLAKDELHPSSEGYRVWFEAVQSSLKTP